MKEHLLKAGANMEVFSINLCSEKKWEFMKNSHVGPGRGCIVQDSSPQDLVQDLPRSGTFHRHTYMHTLTCVPALIHLHTCWFAYVYLCIASIGAVLERSCMAQVMHLTNGTMQINFFKDHTKVCIWQCCLKSSNIQGELHLPLSSNCSSLVWFQIILCPLLGAVTYIDEARKNRTFRWELKCWFTSKVEMMINCWKLLKFSLQVWPAGEAWMHHWVG